MRKNMLQKSGHRCWYYMEGFNIREISDILDMKESTVKSRLQRGRKQIAELYEYKVREGRA